MPLTPILACSALLCILPQANEDPYPKLADAVARSLKAKSAHAPPPPVSSRASLRKPIPLPEDFIHLAGKSEGRVLYLLEYWHFDTRACMARAVRYARKGVSERQAWWPIAADAIDSTFDNQVEWDKGSAPRLSNYMRHDPSTLFTSEPDQEHAYDGIRQVQYEKRQFGANSGWHQRALLDMNAELTRPSYLYCVGLAPLHGVGLDPMHGWLDEQSNYHSIRPFKSLEHEGLLVLFQTVIPDETVPALFEIEGNGQDSRPTFLRTYVIGAGVKRSVFAESEVSLVAVFSSWMSGTVLSAREKDGQVWPDLFELEGTLGGIRLAKHVFELIDVRNADAQMESTLLDALRPRAGSTLQVCTKEDAVIASLAEYDKTMREIEQLDVQEKSRSWLWGLAGGFLVLAGWLLCSRRKPGS